MVGEDEAGECDCHMAYFYVSGEHVSVSLYMFLQVS